MNLLFPFVVEIFHSWRFLALASLVVNRMLFQARPKVTKRKGTPESIGKETVRKRK
jgi:hypothetical protein